MVLPDTTRSHVESTLAVYCAARVPERLRHEIVVKYRIRTTSVTLYQERRSYRDPDRWITLVIAQLRYNLDLRHWKLYCADRHSRWHRYDLAPPSRTIDPLLEEIDRDPTGIFWG